MIIGSFVSWDNALFPSDVGVVLSYLGWLHRMEAFVETSDEDATLDVARFTVDID